MEYSFTRYLHAKKTVDDRAINRLVWQQMQKLLFDRFNARAVTILDLGAGTGTMLQRLIDWKAISRGQYLGIDSDVEVHHAALSDLKEWGKHSGFSVNQKEQQVILSNEQQIIQAKFQASDIYEFLEGHSTGQWDLIIANAFLDLVEVDTVLSRLQNVISPDGFAYFTINYDGLTRFEPEIDPELDSLIFCLYDQSMDERSEKGMASGGSKTGRKLFSSFEEAGWEVLAAGRSDWIVHPTNGKYPADERYFLVHMLHFIEDSLSRHPLLDAGRFADWVRLRRQQINNGALTFIAHNLDFLAAPQK